MESKNLSTVKYTIFCLAQLQINKVCGTRYYSVLSQNVTFSGFKQYLLRDPYGVKEITWSVKVKIIFLLETTFRRRRPAIFRQ